MHRWERSSSEDGSAAAQGRVEKTTHHTTVHQPPSPQMLHSLCPTRKLGWGWGGGHINAGHGPPSDLRCRLPRRSGKAGGAF